ncbi:hypothetical protein [Klenkia terrae]|uniref:Uncharacterized protein n=1 Tax=Klenkia terrae TaxID=1052259 RepID=A0ABU8E6C7_9ACTN|nr:hypothetical protein [Klenkia terrae]
MSGPLQQVLSRAASLGGAALGKLQHTRIPGVGQASTTEPAEVSAARWRAVTVYTDDLAGPFPELDALGSDLEVRMQAAPGGRGTELAARFHGSPTTDQIGELRAALRRTKQLAEVGEVLRVDPQPHGTRKATPQGAALEGAAARAPKEGVL